MERVFLTCFPSLRRSRKPSSSTNIDEPVTLFSSLITDVDRLQTISLPEGSISLQWCSEATNLLRKMHFQLFLFYEKSDVLGSWDGINILDEYMKETLDLLDLCNSLNSSISAMGRYRLTVDLAVTKLSNDDEIFPDIIATAKTEIERIEIESKKIYGVDEKWKDKNLFETTTAGMPKTKSYRFIYAVKSAVSVMGMLLFSAVLYPVSKIGNNVNEEVYREFPRLKLFSVSLGKLVDCYEFLKGNDDVTRPVLVENKVVEKAVLEIKEEILKGKGADQERLRKSIDLLKKSSLALKEGIEMFEAVVNELFADVVEGRNKLLAMVNTNYKKM
ncbi:hypothetical protein SLA2020_493890 [Shorea laevis]